MALTPKQEKFAMVYVETGNASEAYRQAYSTKRMKPESVGREAKACLDHPKISSRVAELREMHLERHAVTVDSITQELEEARKIAIDNELPAPAVTASMGKAKLHGLLIEKVENNITINDYESMIEQRLKRTEEGKKTYQ